MFSKMTRNSKPQAHLLVIIMLFREYVKYCKIKAKS